MTNPFNWRQWGILFGLSLLTAGFIAYAIAPASILSLLMAEHTIDKPTASASISAIFLTWALLQIPGGLVIDRYDVRRLITLATGLFILAATTGLLIDSYPGFLLTRLISGASAVFIFVGSVTVLNQVLPPQRHALGMSIFIASPPVGIALAQFSGPLLAQPYGWRTPLLVYIILATTGLLIVHALLRTPIKTTEPATISQFITALRTRSVLLVSLTSLCTYTIWTFLVTWMPTYGVEVLGFNLATAGAATALVPLAGIIARPSGGWLSDHLGGRLRPVILASFLITIILVYFLNNAPSPTGFAILLALTGAAVNLGVGLYLVYISRLAQTATRGTSLAVLLTFSQTGNLIAPVIGGWTITTYSWTGAFGFAIALAALGIVTILLVPPSPR